MSSIRPKYPAKYETDLNFADYIILIPDNAVDPQKQLESEDIMAHRVGSKIK
jgi:hypothetical protein